MASLRKRRWRTPSGKPRTAWQVDYRDQQNCRRIKQFRSQAEARKWLETTDLHSRAAAPNGKTVADAAEAFIERAVSDELERTTIEYYQRAQKYIVAYIGSTLLADLTRQQVIAFRRQLGRDKTRATATRATHVLKMMLNQAVDDDWVGSNVARRLRTTESSRHRKGSRKKINVPSRADLATMAAYLEQRVRDLREKRAQAEHEKDPEKARLLRDERNMAERSRALFPVLFDTGARPSELRGLAWPQVKWQRGGIDIDQRVDRYNEMGDCKTEASYRFIPLPETTMEVLKEWKALCPASAQDLVFPTAGGRPISSRNMWREFDRLQIAAGVTRILVGADGKERHVKKYTLKDCRHGAASRWINERINLKKLTTRMGHSSIQVTFDVYGHIIEEVEAMDADRSTSDDSAA